MPDENKDTPLDLTKNPQFAQLASLVGQLGKGMQGLQQLVTSTNANLTKLTETVTKGVKVVPDKKEEPPPDDDAVNDMTQAQLVTHLFKGVREMVDGVKTELSKRVDEVTDGLEKKDLTTEVQKLRGDPKNKDFDDFVPEIKEKLSANPGLSMTEAYMLVKAANPEKTRILAEKYKTDLEPEKKPVFGGLTPTSRAPGAESDDKGGEKMTRTEALEKSWDETFGDNPGLAGEDAQD